LGLKNKSTLSIKYPDKIYNVSNILTKVYKDFDHYNKKNPIDELLFILCSIRTFDNSYIKSYEKLKESFPDCLSLYNAPIIELKRLFLGSGLQNQKARYLKKIFTQLLNNFGTITLSPLHNMTDNDCEKFLASLPGIGKKAARCIMLYSLDRKVFPVDTHCWRVLRRLGWVRGTRKDESCSKKDMDRIQRKIPPQLRFSLHVNMLSLGREYCTFQSPDCIKCPVNKFCKKIGTKRPLLIKHNF
jgi:endonuclease III